MAGRFLTHLVVEQIPTDERLNARVTRPLVYQAGDGRRLTVPRGFRTDLASIPQLLQAAIGKWERHAPAAVVHDWLYTGQQTSRRGADHLFLEALAAAGVTPWKRRAMFAAVRAGGWRAWRRNRTASIGDHRMARDLPFERLEDEYRALWEAMEIRPERERAVTAAAERIISGRARYVRIANEIGLPWYVVGLLHHMESGCDFTRHLHNGDPLTARTVCEPKNRPATHRGPFTFEESAADALLLKRLDAVETWSVARIAYECERNNGFGYRLYHPGVLTPYLWSFTTHYERGKYASDGKWSSSLVSAQPGAMAILRRLADLDRSIVLDAPPRHAAEEHRRTPAEGPTTMAGSTEAVTATTMGGTGGYVVSDEIAGAFGKVAAAGKAGSFGDMVMQLVLQLGASKLFWVGVIMMVGSTYMWLRRRARLSGRLV